MPSFRELGQSRFSKDQQFVIAAFDLDVAKVKALLADGADPNARLGFYDERLFEDKWLLSYSDDGSDKWTPLLAVANSHREPQPKTRTKNTESDLRAAVAKLRKIDSKLIRERDERRLAITKLLIAAKADLNLEDGHGLTALAAATEGYEDVALLLIDAGAEINTKTGVYIDGPSDITPLHIATSSPKVLEAMLKRNPKLDVADTSGETPLHWAARYHNVTSVRLLLAAGADPQVNDKKGRTPAHWVETYREDPHRVAKAAIAKLLSDAVASRKASASKK